MSVEYAMYTSSTVVLDKHNRIIAWLNHPTTASTTDVPLGLRFGINLSGETSSTDDDLWSRGKTYVPDWRPPKGVRRIRIKKKKNEQD